MTEAEEGPKILCDPAWISQAVDNLLSNAIKYSHSGTFVRVCLTFSPAAVRLDVTDQGQGIPEKELSKLFGYFQRLSPRPTGGEKSTGLGLSIVKAVVNAHRGRVTVESGEGRGSVFSFTLPRAAESEITSR